MPPPGLYQSRKLAKSRSQPKGRSNTSKRTTVDRTYAPFHSQALSEPVAMHNPYNSVASQPLPQPIPGPSNSPTLPSPRTSLHSHNVNTAPPFTYPGVHTINDTLTSRSPATPSMTPVYANPTWSPAPLNYSAPAPIIVSPQMRGTISLPPVNAMYDEQQLFPLRDSLGPSFSQPVYNHAQPMGSVAPVEPWYDYSPSQDDNDSDVSKESHGSGLALAPMHDLEKRRFVYRRDSLDDRALRSLL
ncbi:hypothetical protein H0H92_007802 [Tricholoma furcatifolium]|nr:hypothetical protein H0H92_007802 [Tricholoma furcatifolium]